MPSQLAEMALLVLASLGRFLRVSRLKDSSRDQRRATKLSLSLSLQWKQTRTISNSFYSFLSDSLDEPVDRVKDPERSERPELLTHALRYVPPSACLI
jgi:hypothetical protein